MTLSTVNSIGAIGGAVLGVLGTIVGGSVIRLGAKRTWRAGALLYLACFVFMVIVQYLHAKAIGFKPIMLIGPIVFLVTFLWWLIKREPIEGTLARIESAVRQGSKTEQ